MMKKTLWLALFVSGNVLAVGQAWVDAQQAASANLGRSAGAVTPSNAANIGATHNDSATVDNLKSNFAASNAGNAGLSSFGDQKVASCQNYVPNPNMPARDQECEAVNALKNTRANDASAITGITKSDPMFTNPNSMVNLGLNSTGTQTGIGSGTGQSGITGAGACVQATSTTPAQFTERTCTRAAAPANRTCTKTVSPSITTTKTCNISGSIYVAATPDAHNSPGPSFGQSKNIVNGQYRLTFSCDPNIAGIGNVEFGPNAIFPNSPRGGANTVWWHNGQWGVHWQSTKKVAFSPGTAQTWGPYKMMQGSGSCGSPYGRDHYLHYDGTNWYVTESGNGFSFCWLSGGMEGASVSNGGNLWLQQTYSLLEGESISGVNLSHNASFEYEHGWNHDKYGFCAPGYTYVSSQTREYVTGASSWGTDSNGSYVNETPKTVKKTVAYCTKSTDPAIINASFGSCNSIAPSGAFNIRAINSLTDGTANPNGGACAWQVSIFPGYALRPFSCPAGSQPYGFLASEGCLKDFPRYYIPNVNPPVNRGMRHFGKAAGNYNGFVGIKNVYSQTINDSCATYQAATQNPSSVPATSVNGQLVCPAGKTLSGVNCV